MDEPGGSAPGPSRRCAEVRSSGEPGASAPQDDRLVPEGRSPPLRRLACQPCLRGSPTPLQHHPPRQNHDRHGPIAAETAPGPPARARFSKRHPATGGVSPPSDAFHWRAGGVSPRTVPSRRTVGKPAGEGTPVPQSSRLALAVTTPASDPPPVRLLTAESVAEPAEGGSQTRTLPEQLILAESVDPRRFFLVFCLNRGRGPGHNSPRAVQARFKNLSPVGERVAAGRVGGEQSLSLSHPSLGSSPLQQGRGVGKRRQFRVVHSRHFTLPARSCP